MVSGPTGSSLEYITLNQDCTLGQYYSNNTHTKIKIYNPFPTGCIGPTGIGIENITINDCGDIDGYYSNEQIKRFGKIVATGQTGIFGTQGPVNTYEVTGPIGYQGKIGNTGSTGYIPNYVYNEYIVGTGNYYITNDITYSEVIGEFRKPFEYNLFDLSIAVFGMENTSISYIQNTTVLTAYSYLNENEPEIYYNPYGIDNIAVGQNDYYNQGNGAIAIGYYSGYNQQYDESIAIGFICGSDYQGYSSISIGTASAYSNQGSDSVAIGNSSGSIDQGSFSITIGKYSGYFSQSDFTIAIANCKNNDTEGAGLYFQDIYSIAIGNSAGTYYQFMESIAIGNYAGYLSLGNNCISIGTETSSEDSSNCINIGYLTGYTNQRDYAIAIGNTCGFNNQLNDSIAIGAYSALENQSFNSIAIGIFSGTYNQNSTSIAIGYSSCFDNQDLDSISIGSYAGYQNQGTECIAIGKYAGVYNQEDKSIVIGVESGNFLTENCVVIGYNSGNDTDKNTIILGQNPISTQGFQDAFFTIPELLPCIIGSELLYDVVSGQIGPNVSSKRFKNNIKYLNDSIVKNIVELKVKRFDKNGKSKIGLIAEDVYKYYPEIVNLDQDELPYSINYSLLNIILLKQLQLILKSLN